MLIRTQSAANSRPIASVKEKMTKNQTAMPEALEPAVADAEARLAKAQAQLASVESHAAEAAQESNDILQRLTAGDLTVTVDDMVKAAPEAERRAAVVPHYRKAAAAAEQALRTARTNALVARIQSGAAGLLTDEQLEKRLAPTVADLADVFVRVEEDMKQAMRARLQVINSLVDTTAHGPSYMFPNGQPDSPLQIHKSAGQDRFEVDGVVYRDYLPQGVVKVVIDKALHEVERRKSAEVDSH